MAFSSSGFLPFLPPFQHEWYSRKAKAKDAVGQYYLDAEFDYITEAAIKAFIAQNGPINLPSEQLFSRVLSRRFTHEKGPD